MTLLNHGYLILEHKEKDRASQEEGALEESPEDLEEALHSGPEEEEEEEDEGFQDEALEELQVQRFIEEVRDEFYEEVGQQKASGEEERGQSSTDMSGNEEEDLEEDDAFKDGDLTLTHDSGERFNDEMVGGSESSSYELEEDVFDPEASWQASKARILRKLKEQGIAHHQVDGATEVTDSEEEEGDGALDNRQHHRLVPLQGEVTSSRRKRKNRTCKRVQPGTYMDMDSSEEEEEADADDLDHEVNLEEEEEPAAELCLLTSRLRAKGAKQDEISACLVRLLSLQVSSCLSF